MLQYSMPEDFDIKHCSFCTSWSPARSKLGGFCFSSDLFEVRCGRECNCKGAVETVFFSNVTLLSKLHRSPDKVSYMEAGKL